MPPEGYTRAGILPGCPSLDRGSREKEVGFEPRTFRSINSRSNQLGHLAPLDHCTCITTMPPERSTGVGLPKPRQGKSRRRGRIRTTDIPASRPARKLTFPRLLIIRRAELYSQPTGILVRDLRSVTVLPGLETAQSLRRQLTDRKVRGSNPTSPSLLLLPTLGQPGSICPRASFREHGNQIPKGSYGWTTIFTVLFNIQCSSEPVSALLQTQVSVQCKVVVSFPCELTSDGGVAGRVQKTVLIKSRVFGIHKTISC
ncbi:hypothetical protein CSKR_107904 [Clonorchis sinensis]|uniref:Uncharacterized protein n=1 Tax=Clonorchis sinensis TaxID=79923 RepID=A0A419PMW3_CLOSI|nr:hypothetical protein CSKR_107904 [Clonorchis sinensis]